MCNRLLLRKLVASQGAMGEVLNLGETINNRLESTFNKIKSICSKYANLVQCFTEFFTVLKCLRSDRSCPFLMSLVRRSTNNLSKSTVEKSYSNTLSLYVYPYLEKEMRKDKGITILEQIDHQTYRVNDGGHSLVLTAHICPCQFMKQMEFPCYIYVAYLFVVALI